MKLTLILLSSVNVNQHPFSIIPRARVVHELITNEAINPLHATPYIKYMNNYFVDLNFVVHQNHIAHKINLVVFSKLCLIRTC